MNTCQNSVPKILVVDDERSMREFLEIMLQQDGYRVQCVDDGEKAARALRDQSFDLIITDIRMQPMDGLEVLKMARSVSPRTVVIIISAYSSTETAVAAMKEGAYDYLPKPFQIDEMRTVIGNALESRNGNGRPPPQPEGPLYFGCLMGESPPMRRVYELIGRVASNSSNVLITGESGTGKELVARAIHGQSPRSGRPLVIVNCGGVPENLVESELFGYRKGAFTGASSNRKGLVEAAQGGTLFLDEIGELTPALQVKLLRLVQEKTIKMIGDTENTEVDTRIISATNRDLEQMVMEGTFREDLYYRLNVLPIHLPPLRERSEDIALLARHFLSKFSKRFGKDIRKISSFALDILRNYDFPGNIRELEHIIERGVALEASSIILPDSLTLSTHKRSRNKAHETHAPALPEGTDLDSYLAHMETRLLAGALKQADGVKHKAAEILGISFRSFRYRLLKYGLASEEDAS